MSNQLKLIMGLITLLALLAAPAQATMVVDTGHADSGFETFQFNSNHYYAGEFHTDQDYLITRVQGYLYWASGAANTLNAVIRKDDAGGSIPGTTQFSPVTFTATGPAGAWQGPSSLSWYLPAGDYWVSIEVPSGSTFSGYQYFAAANRGLAQYASYNVDHWQVASGGGKLSFQVEGTPVPLPPTVWLLGAGLLGLGGLRLRRH